MSKKIEKMLTLEEPLEKDEEDKIEEVAPTKLLKQDKNGNIPEDKRKRPQTEAQKANTEKMRLALLAKHETSRKEKERIAMEKQQKMEERILKKSQSIQKRQQKEMKIIEEIPSEESDEESDEEIEAPPPKKKNIKKKIIKPVSSDEEEEFEEEPPTPVKQRKYIQQQQYYAPQPQRPIIRYV